MRFAFEDQEPLAPIERLAEPPARSAALVVVLGAVEVIRQQRDRPLKPKDARDQLVALLRLRGWTCRTRHKVEGRGTADGYKGVLDLVAHPPQDHGASLLPDPVLVEFDAVHIEHRTLSKLAHYEGQTAGKLVVLTRATDHPPEPSLDALICLA